MILVYVFLILMIIGIGYVAYHANKVCLQKSRLYNVCETHEDIVKVDSVSEVKHMTESMVGGDIMKLYCKELGKKYKKKYG